MAAELEHVENINRILTTQNNTNPWKQPSLPFNFISIVQRACECLKKGQAIQLAVFETYALITEYVHIG